MNGNVAIDGPFSNGEHSDNVDMDYQNEFNEEIETKHANNFGEQTDRVQPQILGNVNSQRDLNQYGIANTNLQGGMMQQQLRRQNKSTQVVPKQHIVCGYQYKTIYPNVQLQSFNFEDDAIEKSLQYSNDIPLTGHYTMRRFYSGPFNHLL